MIDFNADLGEGCPHDAELMRYVNSVNIACAAHAGSPDTMMQALQGAASRELRIGAHPGYFDRDLSTGCHHRPRQGNKRDG